MSMPDYIMEFRNQLKNFGGKLIYGRALTLASQYKNPFSGESFKIFEGCFFFRCNSKMNVTQVQNLKADMKKLRKNDDM